MSAMTVDQALSRIGTGPFQYRLLAIGFAAPSLAAEFGLTIPAAVQAGIAY